MKDGSLKKINPDYRETLPNGDIINGQGSKLSNVECCPNEPNCGDNFEYEQVENSCFTDSQCTNAGGPIPTTSNTYVNFRCEDGVCTMRGPFEVECTTNAGCSDGQICDLSTTNYGVCITQTGQDYCGDKICSLLENKIGCPADCVDSGIQCKWYQDSFTKIEKDYGTLYWRAIVPFVNPKETAVSGCKTSSWIYLLIGGLFIILVITIILLVPAKGGKKK